MNVIERIKARVTIDGDSGCHIFGGALDNGYGRVGLGDRRTGYTHRVMYVAAKGPIPDGHHVDHLCRNRACCNPDHLEAVTPAENLRRAALVRYPGVRGVYHYPQLSARNPWLASIQENGKSVYLGMFATREEAVAARLGAEKRSGQERRTQIEQRVADLNNEPGDGAA